MCDGVDAVFVERAMLTESKEIQLQGFALNQPLVGTVANGDVGKVRLSCLGADIEIESQEAPEDLPDVEIQFDSETGDLLVNISIFSALYLFCY